MYQNYFEFQSLLFTNIKLWNFRILDTFCHIFFNSTYTRVDLYASMYGRYTRWLKGFHARKSLFVHLKPVNVITDHAKIYLIK
jgi:hypothetical protein